MLDFPNAPTVGQKYPASPVGGVPTYVWDGEKWTTIGGAPAVGLPPSDVVPRMDGAGAAGTSINYSRGDHQHPTDTSRAPINAPVFTGGLTTNALTVTGTASFGGAITAVSITTTGNAAIGGVVSAPQVNIGGSASAAPLAVRPAANENLVVFNNSGMLTVSALNDAGAAAPMTLSASTLALLGAVSFNLSPIAPTPTLGDNSTKVATTAFVLANMPAPGGFLPLSGGTLTGALVVNADIASTVGSITTRGWSGNQATGLIFFGNSGARYCYYDGSNFTFNGGVISAANGRLWGAADALPVPGGAFSNARLVYAGDPGFQVGFMYEPYGGAVVTGISTDQFGAINNARWRYLQFYTTSWWTVGYA